jgi:hypothetical protein
MSARLLLAAPPPSLPWAVSHAALPVVDDERGELLFATRDEQGRSRIARAFVAFDGEPEVRGLDPHPVLDLGELGAFDDAGVTTSCLVRHADRRYLWYTGWTRGVSVPFALFAGCALSEDGGETYRRVSRAPLLERNDVDPLLTASPWVLVEDGRWRMWYVSATGWSVVDGESRHRYHVRYAESDDGLSWRREGVVALDFEGDEHAISRPCVVRELDRYVMWFSSRGAAYRIGRAESEDGIRWTRVDSGFAASGEEWDAEMQCYPLAVGHHLLYNGNGYGATGIGVRELP